MAPIIIFQGDKPEQGMLFFYACTFGVGLLSSGFSNTTHYLVQKDRKKEGLINFAGIYGLVRFLDLNLLFEKLIIQLTLSFY
jgi:hypothetical protein